MTTTATPHRQVVQLERNGQYVRITDEEIALLGDITATEIVCDNDCHCVPVSRSLLRWSETYQTMSGEERSGICPIPNAGCLPILERRAQERGLELCVSGTCPIATFPEPTLSRAGYPALHEFVRQHERGLIKVSKGFDIAIFPWELIRAFPGLRLIVIGTKVRKLRSIRDTLAATPTLRDRIQLVHSRHQLALQPDELPPQVSCCTPSFAGDMDLSTCDLVLMLDAYSCTRRVVQMALAEQDARFRLFGVVRSGSTPSPYQEARTLATFGPELIDVMYFGKVRRAVQVAWRQHRQPRIQLHSSSVQFARRCYWQNEERNAELARLADEFTDGTVAILVDRPQHAVSLARMLPAWRVCAGDDSLNVMPGSIRRRVLRDRCRWHDGRRQIVLTDAARDSPGRSFDVVIWAGGGQSRAPVPLSWMTDHSVSARPMLLVDFQDRFNRHVRTLASKRRADCEKHDMFEVDITLAEGRIRRILRSQRRGT